MTPPLNVSADPDELKFPGMISLGVQMVIGQKLPDSTNHNTPENLKNAYYAHHMVLVPPPV